MANIDNILQELEKADEYKEQIENEINNILRESDSVLVKAESQLNVINNNDPATKIEKDIENSSESSFALSIEVSRDLFKEFDNEHDISAIYPPSDDITLTKLPDDVIEVKNSELEENKLIEETEDNTDENNDTLGPSLEITITNDAEDNEKDELNTTLLNNSSTFQGCSDEFASNGVKEIITVVVNVDKPRLISLSEYNKQENVIKESKLLQETPLNEAAENQPKDIIKVDINSNNEINPEAQKMSVKRPIDEDYQEVAKKLKIDDLTKSDEVIQECDQTQTEYTRVIFDPDDTADANDPKWLEYNSNGSIEDHFELVREQWRSISLPNPHENLTKRFIHGNCKYKFEAPAKTENEYGSMSCVQYLDNKVNRYTQKVNDLYSRLNYLPVSNRGRTQRNKILKEIEELQKFVIEIVKNREEVQQNFMFYQHPNNAWDANYLTRTQLDELKEQDKLLEFQKRFYSE